MKKYLLIMMLALLLLPTVMAQTQIATDDFECGAFNCGAGWTGGWAYTGTCEVMGANALGSYNMRGVSGCDATKNLDTTGYTEVNVSFYATAGSLEAADTCSIYYYDGTTDHLLLTLVNGDDDNNHDYYEYDITSYGLNSGAGLRFVSPSTAGDYCYIDNVTFSGITATDLNLFVEENYLAGSTGHNIEATSSITSTQHTIELAYPNGTIFCTDTITSPSIAYSSFSTICDMPNEVIVNASAKLYLTGTPAESITEYFNVVVLTSDDSKLKINKVYHSPQVLQGGQTEIFALLNLGNNITVDKATVTLTYPDATSRIFYMDSTLNSDEYRALITDTYLVGNVLFTVYVEAGVYYAQYSNQYTVAAYNVDFVETVNSVAICQAVYEVLEPEIEMHGTEYFSDEPVKVWLQLLDGNKSEINDAVCYLWVYSPANTYYITRANMYFVENGIYAYDFDAPYIGGVYPAISVCYFTAQQTYTYANGFTPYTYSTITGTYLDTHVLDLSDHAIKETVAGAPKRIAVEYNFTNVCTNATEDLLSGFTVGLNGAWSSATDDNLILSWYNWSDSSWNELPNQVMYNTDRLLVTNSKETNNLSKDGYTDTNGNFRLRINDTPNVDGGTSFLYLDYLYITCDELANPEWSEMKGSSEVHVTLDESSITGLLLEEETIDLVPDTTYEGNIVINFTVYSRVLEPTLIEHKYALPEFLTCEDIINFAWYENGSWTEYYHDDNSSVFTCGKNEDLYEYVDLIWIREMELDGIYSYSLALDNRIKRNADKYITNINFYYPDMNGMCLNYFAANSLGSKPTIPLQIEPNYNDTFANGCAYFWNTYYFFNESESNLNNLYPLVTTPEEFNLYEEHFFRIKQFYDLMVNDFIIGAGSMNLYSDYSLMQGSYPFQFWANYTTPKVNYLFALNNASEYNWNYNSRTLTGQEHLWVGGTEYSLDETVGKIVTRLVDTTDTPVDNANCTIRIFYPNNTAYIFDDEMIHYTPPGNITGAGGIYLYDFNLSGVAGVHPYGIDCEIISGPSPKHYYLLDTFHVFGTNLTKTAEAIWEYDNRTLTNATNIAPDIWGGNYTINPGLLAQFVGSVWDYVSRYTHGIVN